MTDKKHTSFCIKSLRDHVPPKLDVPQTEDFDFGTALESVYPLLDIIFGFLDYRDLKNASKVQKSWEEVANRVLSKRNKAGWVTCYKPKKQNGNTVESSSNLQYTNVGVGIILYNERHIKLHNYVCVHKNISLLAMKAVVEYFADEVVPDNIDYCLISCPKVISYFPKEHVQETLNDAIFDGLILPVIPNIRTAMFHCNPRKVKDLKTVLEKSIRSDEMVKCVLMFCKTDLRSSIYNLLDELLIDTKPSTVAVGGGIIKSTKSFQQILKNQRYFSYSEVLCVAFTKKREEKCDFDSFSIVIAGDDLSKDEFEEELVKFKNSIVLRSHSAAFRICCSAKVNTEVESHLFGKIFPGIPLLGFDADGEVGWNCYNGVPNSSKTSTEDVTAKRQKRDYPEVQHQFSTVLVLITWGPISTPKQTNQKEK